MKEQLVFNNKGTIYTTSRKVAEMFEKQHKHVLRDIRNLIEEMNPIMDHKTHSPKMDHEITEKGNFHLSKYFVESTYVSSRGREEVEYLLTRDGFTLLAMGFRGPKALRFKMDYIEAYNAMEQALASLKEEQIDLARRLAERNNRYFERSVERLSYELEEAQEEIEVLKADYEELRQYNKEWVDYANSLENYIAYHRI